jgi:acetyl esterase/lipase
MISDKWIMMGASAGAHLALLHAYKYPAPVKIKAVVDFFGPTNLVELYNNPGIIPPSAIASIIGFTPAQNLALYQQSSPVNYVNSAACATIILQGTADLLVNHISQSQALYNLLNAAAVPSQYVVYANKGHGDWDAATFADAFTNIQAFVQRYNP